MFTQSGPIEPSDKQITWAIVQAAHMWADEKYKGKLLGGGAEFLEPDWFKQFLSDWSVARVVRIEHQDDIRNFLNGRFRKAIARDKSGRVVTAGARHIAQHRWTHKVATTGKRMVPISLVSKTAFFFHPERFVPCVGYSRRGINLLLGAAHAGGAGHIQFKTYEEYLEEFNKFFRKYERKIASEVALPWVKVLAKGLGCDNEALSSPAFRRKVFDSVLMGVGAERQEGREERGAASVIEAPPTRQ
jgi:hypothetical protein